MARSWHSDSDSVPSSCGHRALWPNDSTYGQKALSEATLQLSSTQEPSIAGELAASG